MKQSTVDAAMKVSVSMITYNHESFIAQAIEGVLMQETNFPFELVIGEDCSTDGTRAIALDYQERYPDKIRLLLPDNNLGMHENYRQVLKNCRGQYVALLDGDDYWNSPHKLQKQVDLLDAHPEHAICFHNVTEIYEDGSQQPHNHRPPDQKEVTTLDDLLLTNYLPYCAVMFRRGLFDDLPAWYFTTKIDDWSLHVLNAQHGSIGYINEVMGVYRHHVGGVWYNHHRSHILRLQETIKTYQNFRTHLGGKYADKISALISGCYYEMAKAYADGGDLADAKSSAERCLAERKVSRYLSTQKLLILRALCHAPAFYRLAMGMRRSVVRR
jgi:glycosyltransferase involved in cell wall biosynthesis